jgi:hypothetical protein
MKQTFIFAIILLATLSIVNAAPFHKRATTFAPCPAGYPNQIKVLVSPDPPAIEAGTLVTITGTLTSGTLTAGSQVFIGAMDTNSQDIGTPLITDFCSAEGLCPVSTGDSFTVVKSIRLTGTFPATYSLVVSIRDASGTTVACAIGTVTNA